jgi:uncharacterized protein DUF3558
VPLVRRVVGGLLIVVMASACAIPGSAGPAPEARPSGAVELPPRPREVRLDGVDPCSLLTEQQRAELGLDGRPLFSKAPVGLYGGAEVPLCTVRGFEPRAVTVGVSLVTSVGIERYTSGELAAELRLIDVQGFPGVVAVPTRFTDYCTAIVDVAPGQLLDVQFATGGRQPPIPQPQLCQDAQTVAGEVMSTLLDG